MQRVAIKQHHLGLDALRLDGGDGATKRRGQRSRHAMRIDVARLDKLHRPRKRHLLHLLGNPLALFGLHLLRVVQARNARLIGQHNRPHRKRARQRAAPHLVKPHHKLSARDIGLKRIHALQTLLLGFQRRKALARRLDGRANAFARIGNKRAFQHCEFSRIGLLQLLFDFRDRRSHDIPFPKRKEPLDPEGRGVLKLHCR